MIGKNATWPGSGCSTEMPSNRYSLVRGRPPLMRGSCELGGSATPGASDGERDEAPAVQRQLHHLLVIDDGAEAGRFGAEDRRVAGHRHLLAHAADRELEVEPHLFAGLELHARAPLRIETR